MVLLETDLYRSTAILNLAAIQTKLASDSRTNTAQPQLPTSAIVLSLDHIPPITFFAE